MQKLPKDPYAELLAALQSVAKSDDGMTVREIAEKMRIADLDVVRTRLREAIAKGKVTHGRRLSTRIDGVKQPIPVYKLKGSK